MNNELENRMVIGEYDDPFGKKRSFNFYISQNSNDDSQDRDYDRSVEKKLWRDK